MDIKKNFDAIRKELDEILTAIENEETDEIIKDSYDYTQSMLDFIKKKDKIFFEEFFDVIKDELDFVVEDLKSFELKNKKIKKENLEKYKKICGDFIVDKSDELRKELLKHKNLEKKIIYHIIDSIFDDGIIYDNNNNEEIYNDDDNDKFIEDVKLEEVIENFEWRENQLKAINNTIEQNFASGVHNQIMGAGKTLIILHSIQRHYDLKKNNNLYILTTNRQEILKGLFFNDDGSINDDKKKYFNNHNIINLDKFNVIVKLNFEKEVKGKKVQINNKDKNLNLDKKKPNILIINTDYFKILHDANIIDYKKCNIIILDECHGISAPKLYEVIKKIKYDFNVPIIGFSATPLREKAEEKLKDIFSKSFDKDEKNKKLNIISNYDFINAIKDNVILPPYYILCEVNKTLNGRIGKSNKDITKKVLENVLKIAPYGKIIGWCRNQKNLKEYCDFFKLEFKNHKLYCSSTFDKAFQNLGYNTNWNDFAREEKKATLLCINKGREGSDIQNLDIAIYLDVVKKRSLLVSLQTSGRVLRHDKKNKKTHGLIIDTFVNVDGIQIEQMTAKRIINYYKQIFALCDDNDYSEQKELYNEMVKICDNIDYDEKKEEITVRIDENVKHNMKFKLELKTKAYDFNKMKVEINAIMDKMFNVDKKTKFDIIVEKLKKSGCFSLQTIKFWTTYDKIKDKSGMPSTHKELYDEYKEIFDSHTWYDILGLDTDKWYTTVSECKKALKKIYDKEITDKIYEKALSFDDKLPINPYEFYKFNGFKSIKESFNTNGSVKSVLY
jgi:superfamily II DNA or RNA helicase